jgi:hypothetical protein
MIRKIYQLLFMLMFLFTAGCIKETYDMNKLSQKMQLTPGLAISAIKGDISFSDMVKPNDTIIFDQNKYVKIIFRKDPLFDLSLIDFLPLKNLIETSRTNNGKLIADPVVTSMNYLKGPTFVAKINPDTLNLDIGDILKKVSGEFQISSPTIKFYYSNSFGVPLKIKLNATGIRKGKQPVNLNLDTLSLNLPAPPLPPDVSGSFTIDKSTSNLPKLLSLPPEEIIFSGAAVLNPFLKNNPGNNNIVGTGRIKGRIEIEIPLEFRMNKFQYADTIDNFLKDDGNSGNNPVKPEDFELVRIDINARNGFPFGVSLKMSLYDSATQTVKSTVDATGILESAPTDSNGKVTDVTETGTSIEFTKEFFSSVTKADKVIFYFTLNTTDNGSKDVKIYSDYRIDFNAALVIKPVIKLK